MNGAKAEPLASTSRAPSSTRKIAIGASHHLLCTRRKSQNSLRMASLFIGLSNWSRFQTIAWQLAHGHARQGEQDRPPSKELFQRSPKNSCVVHVNEVN